MRPSEKLCCCGQRVRVIATCKMHRNRHVIKSWVSMLSDAWSWSWVVGAQLVLRAAENTFVCCRQLPGGSKATSKAVKADLKNVSVVWLLSNPNMLTSLQCNDIGHGRRGKWIGFNLWKHRLKTKLTNCVYIWRIILHHDIKKRAPVGAISY